MYARQNHKTDSPYFVRDIMTQNPKLVDHILENFGWTEKPARAAVQTADQPDSTTQSVDVCCVADSSPLVQIGRSFPNRASIAQPIHVCTSWKEHRNDSCRVLPPIVRMYTLFDTERTHMPCDWLVIMNQNRYSSSTVIRPCRADTDRYCGLERFVRSVSRHGLPVSLYW